MNIIILQAATEGDGVDVIIEMMANVNLQKDLEMINYHGRIVVCSYIIHNNVLDALLVSDQPLSLSR